jgi:hypothetical protein
MTPFELQKNMSTEQDTFDRLRRIPIEDMCRLVSEYNVTFGPGPRSAQHENLYSLMKDNGWTSSDYIKASFNMGR